MDAGSPVCLITKSQYFKIFTALISPSSVTHFSNSTYNTEIKSSNIFSFAFSSISLLYISVLTLILQPSSSIAYSYWSVAAGSPVCLIAMFQNCKKFYCSDLTLFYYILYQLNIWYCNQVFYYILFCFLFYFPTLHLCPGFDSAAFIMHGILLLEVWPPAALLI